MFHEFLICFFKSGYEVFQETSTGSSDYEYTSWQSTHGKEWFIFQVKSAKNAHIALSDNWKDTSSAFEVVLGLDSVDDLEIRAPTAMVGLISLIQRN